MNESVAFNSGQKMALRAPNVLIRLQFLWTFIKKKALRLLFKTIDLEELFYHFSRHLLLILQIFHFFQGFCQLFSLESLGEVLLSHDV